MRKNYDKDPAWSRTTTASRKRKMLSRASFRLLAESMRRKKQADRHKKRDKVICATRTVEMLPPDPAGNEKTKLLFVIALGLVPNLEKVKESKPLVVSDKLSPEVTDAAQAKTKKVIFELFQKRRQLYFERKYHLCANGSPKRSPSPEEICLKGSPGVEVVDLVSSDDEETSAKPGIVRPPIPRTISPRPYRPIHHHHQPSALSPTVSIPPQSGLLKPSAFNNQDKNSRKIFENWSHEKFKMLMNRSSHNGTRGKAGEFISSPINGSHNHNQSILLNSLKSIPLPALTKSPGWTYAANVSKGSSCTSQLNGIGIRTDATPTSSSLATKLTVPENNVITLD